jgi:membrane-associated phospholipid phosphatase
MMDRSIRQGSLVILILYPRRWKEGSLSNTTARGRRLVLLIALVVVISLYFPINRAAKGGVILDTTLDSYISLVPIWIIPYLGGIGLFVLILLWAYRDMPSDTFAAFVTSNFIAAGVAYTIYLVYPTYISRPAITGTDVLSLWVKWLYATDRVYNAFPSGHAFYTVIAWLYLWHWQSKMRVATTVVATLVLLSTLFTKQHNIVDLVGGIVLGVASVWVGRKLVSRPPQTSSNSE